MHLHIRAHIANMAFSERLRESNRHSVAGIVRAFESDTNRKVFCDSLRRYEFVAPHYPLADNARPHRLAGDRKIIRKDESGANAGLHQCLRREIPEASLVGKTEKRCHARFPDVQRQADIGIRLDQIVSEVQHASFPVEKEVLERELDFERASIRVVEGE